MKKREYILTQKCRHNGCTDTRQFAYGTAKEFATARTRRGESFLCYRHDPAAGHLSMDRLQVSGEVEITSNFPDPDNYPNIANQLSWSTNSSHATNLTGVKWNADAGDFPAGTKIVVRTTVTVELPSPDTSKRLAGITLKKLEAIIAAEPETSWKSRPLRRVADSLRKRLI